MANTHTHNSCCLDSLHISHIWHVRQSFLLGPLYAKPTRRTRKPLRAKELSPSALSEQVYLGASAPGWCGYDFLCQKFKAIFKDQSAKRRRRGPKDQRTSWSRLGTKDQCRSRSHREIISFQFIFTFPLFSLVVTTVVVVVVVVIVVAPQIGICFAVLAFSHRKATWVGNFPTELRNYTTLFWRITRICLYGCLCCCE